MSESTITANISGRQLSQYIESNERLEEEKITPIPYIRDIYSEARATGFGTKIMRQIIKMRGLDKELLAEQDILLSNCSSALGVIEVLETKQDF